MKATKKEAEKRVMKACRLRADINDELMARSEATGIDQTRIVEDALQYYFRGPMQEQLVKVVNSFRSDEWNSKP